MFGLRRRQSKPLLDQVVMHWAAGDPLRVREVLNGGIAVLGASGTGKTSGAGKKIGAGIVRNRRSGGLILIPKLEDVAMWKEQFRSCGRERDLIVFGSLRDQWRFNFLNYLQSRGGNARDITRFIRTLNDSLASGSGSHGEDGKFFEQQEDRVIYNAVEAVRQGIGAVTAPDLQKFVTTAAYSPQQIASEEWQKGFHNQCLKVAFNRKKNRIESHDFDLLQDFWLLEFPLMADKTRSSILAGVLGGLHVFNTGIIRELVSTTTNVTPDDEFKGKWILVNTPPAVFGDSGKLVNAGFKHLTQWANLRRPIGPDSYFNIIWADECQQFLHGREDSNYLAQCRSHLGAMVVLTQSLHSVLGTFKGEGGRHDAQALLSNFHHKVFHALGDSESD